jgi:hypothetical protein
MKKYGGRLVKPNEQLIKKISDFHDRLDHLLDIASDDACS